MSSKINIPQRGEIWEVKLDPAVGAEIKKNRPVLVISSDGIGKLPIKKESARVSAGDTVYIPPMSTQHIENTGKTALVFICIVDPAWKKQDEQILR